MGEGTYYLAFSEKNNPCIASDNLKSLVFSLLNKIRSL